MSKIILHIDMNSYFASVEQQANPHLRGRPVGVCEHLGGIIIAPSVEAKRMGIKLGTPVWEAQKIFPGIVLLPVDPPKVRFVTERFLQIFDEYTDLVERYSIDEVFMDVTKVCHGDYDDALLLGLEIKQRLRLEVGKWISSSIGIGPNKLTAKIAADLGEGDIDRIFVVRPDEIETLYDRLKLTDVPGIGLRLESALNKLGIFSLRELADYPVANLINQFGILGYQLSSFAKFNYISPPHEEGGGGGRSEYGYYDTFLVSPSRREEIEFPKSIGHSYTLPKIIKDLKNIKRLMFKLSEKIGRRMRRESARGNIIHYFHSVCPVVPPEADTTGDKQYSGFHKQHKIREFISDGRDIYRAAFEIFLSSQARPSIKIMGISVFGLKFSARGGSAGGGNEEPLLEQFKKPIWVVEAMDRINNKYGEFTVKRGRLLGIDSEWGRDTVGFGRIKEPKL